VPHAESSLLNRLRSGGITGLSGTKIFYRKEEALCIYCSVRRWQEFLLLGSFSCAISSKCRI